MINTIKKYPLIKLAAIIVLLLSAILHIHNAILYHPSNGFDGYGHMEYVSYVAKYWNLPAPTAWETHQPPLYYFFSAIFMAIFNNIKAAQFSNIFVFYFIIYVVWITLKRIFPTKQALVGTFSLLALPMLNIFPPTLSNELLNTFWIITAVSSCIFLLSSKNKNEYKKSYVILLISLVLGVWTKVTIITVIPTVLLALWLSKKNFTSFLKLSVITILVFGIAYLPIYLRASGTSSPSNITLVASQKPQPRSTDFYYRLDWIPKADMYTTQYYSLLGGAWNSFWTDGHNAITPFVPFHKKSFILWIIGFFLFPLSLYGLYALFKDNKKIGILMIFWGLSMLGFYVLYNHLAPHYSAARLTYQMGIIITYASGIAQSAKNRKIIKLLTILITIQFITLLSFFWIEPWWFATTPKKL